jgi:superfamily I DNA/RNA helicase
MVGVGENSLWKQQYVALQKGTQIIMLGDINQLPPVIGKSVLSYALQQLPVVELNTVHRCALDNPIIRQAHNCLSGKPISEDYNKELRQGVRIFNGNSKIKYSVAYFEIALERLLERMIQAEEYNPMEDMILSPYFKLSKNAISAQNIARIVASIIARREQKEVYEIIAGYQTLYLSVGDRVYLDKIEGIVTKIEYNSIYTGKIPKKQSTNMDYCGQIVSNGTKAKEEEELGEEFNFTALDIERMLDSSDEAEEEKKRSASHIVHIKPRTFLSEEDEPVNTQDHTCSSVGDYASLTLGYALSVHKAQGSEWPNVILALHDSNAQLLFRELLYTGMTRARNRLDILAQAPILEKAQLNQRIKGDSLEAKIEFFNGGYLDQKVEIIP